MFKSNWDLDDSLRWQYFGSSTGLMRLYPAREWDTNFAGFYNDYDPRVRNWYIAATSGPKDGTKLHLKNSTNQFISTSQFEF